MLSTAVITIQHNTNRNNLHKAQWVTIFHFKLTWFKNQLIHKRCSKDMQPRQ